MKKYVFVILFHLACFTLLVSQEAVDSLYFGLEPPGKNSKIFAPGVLSLPNQGEEKLVISNDGKEIYWNIHPMDYTYFKIKYSVYDMDTKAWSTPVFLFEKKYAHSIITPDNNMLVVLEGNIFKSVRSNSGWAEPYIMDSAIFADYTVGTHSITNDTILCFIDLKSEQHDIYISKFLNGHFQLPERLPFPINFENYLVDNPFIAKNGKYLLFTISNYPGGYGNGDIYVSYRKEDLSWTFPKNLGGSINTGEWEYGVYVSPDDKYLFFTRWEFSQNVNIHWVNIEGLLDSLKNTNYLPYKLNDIPDQAGKKGDLFTYSIPDSIFYDDDGSESLILNATLSNGNDLPDSLIFDPETNTLSGKLKEIGDYNIKITATDTAGASISDIFTLTVEQGTALQNKDIVQENIIIYPNPADKKIYIKYYGLNDEVSYKILNHEGKMLMHGKVEDNTIDCSVLNSGLYLVSLEVDNQMISKKIVVE